MTSSLAARMLTGMATKAIPMRTTAAASCCTKCGTGGALLVNDGVALCPKHWWEAHKPSGSTATLHGEKLP